MTNTEAPKPCLAAQRCGISQVALKRPQTTDQSRDRIKVVLAHLFIGWLFDPEQRQLEVYRWGQLQRGFSAITGS